MKQIKTGIVDVGGGLRDIFGAGILEYCMEEGITFDLCVGVSAGAANLASFVAGQPGRNYKFYMEYVFRKEYISFGNWLRTRNYVNLDYSYSTLSNAGGECPLDYEKLRDNPADYRIVATDALTGEPKYFGKADLKQDSYHPVKASGTVPMLNRPYVIGGVPYYDGGISDPIPVAQCLEAGCGKVVLVLTRPKDYRRSADNDKLAVRAIRRKYPQAANALARRADTYNAQLDEALRLEQQGKVLILAPDDIGKMKTLTKDRAVMETLYSKGYEAGKRIPEFLAGSAEA